MSPFSRAAALTALLAAAGAAPVDAQAAPDRVAGIPPGCDYARCALRIEQSWGMRLVRGANGQKISSVGGFGTGVNELLAGPDSARVHARKFQSASRVASTFGLLAAGAWVYSVVRLNQHGDGDDTAAIAGLAATGLTIVSIPFAWRAQRGLSRSIWHYNAALAR